MISRPFRLYDKNTKQMLYPADLKRMGVFLDPDGRAVQVKHRWLSTLMVVLHNVVVMYLTGLKTDRGEDIWEGDILDAAVMTEWGSSVVSRGYMQWDRGNGKWFIYLPKAPAIVGQGEFMLSGATKVGDIYQTPELLKQ